MRVYIRDKDNTKWLDVTNDIISTIKLDERLDEVLDSGQFAMLTNQITEDIEPTTKCYIEHNSKIQYFLCSSESTRITADWTYCLHAVQLFEPTYLLECFVIGSKSFSVVPGRANYNSNYDRLVIMKELIEQEYDITLDISAIPYTGKFLEERAHSFGSGTTAYDIILELFKRQNYLPRITKFDLDNDTFYLSYDDIEALKNKTRKTVQCIIGNVTQGKSVDDYCKNVVTEMPSVVDRDTIQTVMLTCKAKPGDTICPDNACLVLPSEAERVLSVEIKIDSITAPTLKIPASYVDTSATTDYDFTGIHNVNLVKWLEAYVPEVEIRTAIQTWADSYNAGYDNAIVYDDREKLGYMYMSLFSAENVDVLHQDDWVPIPVLSKEQWELLTVEEQTAYIYYSSGSRYIEGFYNTENSQFWDKLIFGEYGPFLEQYLNRNSSTKDNYIYIDRFFNFDEDAPHLEATRALDGAVSITYETDIQYLDSYAQYYPKNNTTYSNNPLDYVYRVKYISKTPLKTKVEKSTTGWKNISKSYNNGANTIDYNQLMPAMQRYADMTGIVETTFSSTDDLNVGDRVYRSFYITDSWIISKQTTFRIENYEPVIEIINYNCSSNYEQIAACVQVKSQYEATNIPANGIIDRYVYIETTNGIVKNMALRSSEVTMSFTSPNGEFDSMVTIPADKRVTGNYIHLVSQAIDNCSIGNKRSNGYGGHYKNEDVKYSAPDLYCKSYSIKVSSWSNLTKDTLNEMPIFDISSYDYVQLQEVLVHKDPRERLFFIIRCK